jgi:colanic acid biosynthesis glycosyl transferase WcaI
MFESMAMGVPMIFAVPGESSRIVMDSGSGVCIPPGDPQSMADAVMRLRNRRETLVQMRQRGRLAVEQHYSRKVKAEEVVRSLEAAVQRKRDP